MKEKKSFFKPLYTTESVENEIYNIIIVISIITSPIITVANYLQNLGLITILNALTYLIFSSVLYYLLRRKNVFLHFLFCLFYLLNLTISWFTNGGGSSGGTQYAFVIALILPVLLLKGLKRRIMVFLTISVMFGLMIYEHVDGRYIIQYSDETTRFVDILVSLILIFVITSIVIQLIFNRIEEQRMKADTLLCNIFPGKIISDLKERGETIPEVFDNATVLFCDLVNFTQISEGIEVKHLINELNDIYSEFDVICSKNRCERIKTIGDCYMAVCGAPIPDDNHCHRIISTAFEIRDYMTKRAESHKIPWKIRIGIHSGQVIGAVVGKTKYIYDIFGDTVNTASRMESSSEPMRINISESVLKLCGDRYTIIERGFLYVKGKGHMKMYFLEH